MQRFSINVMYCGASRIASYSSARTSEKKAAKSFSQWKRAHGTIVVQLFDHRSSRVAECWDVYRDGSLQQKARVEKTKRQYQEG